MAGAPHESLIASNNQSETWISLSPKVRMAIDVFGFPANKDRAPTRCPEEFVNLRGLFFFAAPVPQPSIPISALIVLAR